MINYILPMLRSIAQKRSFSSTAARSAFARMQLLGTVGNINFRETKDKTPFLNYSLAVNRYAPQQSEEGRNTVTDWYSISVFDEKAVNFFQKHMGKGAQIYAETDVKQRTLLDESGENKQTYTSLVQTRFEVVRFPRKESEAESE